MTDVQNTYWSIYSGCEKKHKSFCYEQTILNQKKTSNNSQGKCAKQNFTWSHSGHFSNFHFTSWQVLQFLYGIREINPVGGRSPKEQKDCKLQNFWLAEICQGTKANSWRRKALTWKLKTPHRINIKGCKSHYIAFLCRQLLRGIMAKGRGQQSWPLVSPNLSSP